LGFIPKIYAVNNALKISDPYFNVAKILVLKNSSNGSKELKVTHRQEIGAKALWDNYIIDKSFVQNGNRNQWKVFEGVRIPFGFSDFTSLIKNSYFRDSKNNIGKIDSIKWKINDDFATVDYRIREAYDTSLVETTVEPR